MGFSPFFLQETCGIIFTHLKSIFGQMAYLCCVFSNFRVPVLRLFKFLALEIRKGKEENKKMGGIVAPLMVKVYLQSGLCSSYATQVIKLSVNCYQSRCSMA